MVGMIRNIWSSHGFDTSILSSYTLVCINKDHNSNVIATSKSTSPSHFCAAQKSYAETSELEVPVVEVVVPPVGFPVLVELMEGVLLAVKVPKPTIVAP